MVGAFAGERTRRIYSFVSPVLGFKMNPDVEILPRTIITVNIFIIHLFI